MEHGPALLVEPTWQAAYHAAHVVAEPTGIEAIPLHESANRVIAAPLLARTQLPVAPTSAMDGWAVGDDHGPWRVVGESLAGHPPDIVLTPGTAAVIATGAVVPEGTYGVLRSEYAKVSKASGVEWIEARRGQAEPAPGSNIRLPGEEIGVGEPLLQPGSLMTPPRIGFAAMAGIDKVFVHTPVRGELAVLGDEVLRSGVPTGGQIRDAFGPSLPSLAAGLGLEVDSVRYVPDTVGDAIETLTESTADVLITTGGTAAGPADFLHHALIAADVPLIVDQLAMRPGHPCLLAWLGDNRFLVGLPGNPLAAMVGMLTLAAPLIRSLRGLPPLRFGRVWTAAPVAAPANAARFVPYQFIETDDGPSAQPVQWLGSGMLRGFANADGVMIVPPGGVEAGAEVDDMPLPWQ